MTYAFTLIRGDTGAKPLTIRKATGDRSGVPLTGLELEIAADPDGEQTTDANQIFKKSMTKTDEANGEVEFSLDLADWSGITPGDYFFDIQAVDGTSKVDTLVKGRFRIIQDINKD